jgi:hypothetical protein
MMTKYNPKGRSKQSDRSLQIQAAKTEWLEIAQELEKTKESLGYDHLTWDDFLQLALNDSIEVTIQSRIIELQEKYKEHLTEKKHIWAEDNTIAEINKEYAVASLDQTYILKEKTNALGFRDFSLQSRQSLKTFFENKSVLCIDGVVRCKADIWLKSPNRREYNEIVFDPCSIGSSNGNYNLWQGFARKPIQGNCQRYWAHLKENICNNNEELYRYARKWIASIFQHPDIVHTALVIMGSQGVGKNSFVEPLGILLGRHYVLLSNIHELVSNFNYHLKYAVLIHANEALWGGHRKDIGTLKAMITEEKCLIEGKGKDSVMIKNFKHIILSSNESWPVHLDPDDRRCCVIKASEKHKEDRSYFKALQDELDAGGYEALLHDLLNENLTGFDPRAIPKSSDSFDIKIRSADSAHRYLHEVLREGGFSVGNDQENEYPVWQETIPKNDVYKDYVLWCQNSKEICLPQAIFGKVINKILVSVEDKRPSKQPGKRSRMRCYKFPSLRQVREEFCRAFKETIERIFGEESEL